jgi:hypothetical protein
MTFQLGRDDARDFDFLHGAWRIDNERLIARLSGSNQWERFAAEGTCRPILSGMGNIDDFRPCWPGHDGFEGASLRLFNRETGLWSIYWADTASGRLFPPLVGSFVDGVGEFLGDDEEAGRPVRVRFRWSDITPSAARWEQAFSVDDGATWETNWIMTFARMHPSDD